MNALQSFLFGVLICSSVVDSAQSAAPPEITFRAMASEADTQTINIVSGTYGQNCGAPRGNATQRLARRCDGRRSCDYVLNEAFGDGDTAACRRGFLAEWRCGNTEFHTAALSAGAEQGDTLVLSCVRENGPGR